MFSVIMILSLKLSINAIITLQLDNQTRLNVKLNRQMMKFGYALFFCIVCNELFRTAIHHVIRPVI